MERHGLDYDAPAPFATGKSLGEALLTPTRIYVRNCLAAIRAFPDAVRALAHITGGGLTENIPRVMPEGLRLDASALADWDFPPMFAWLQKTGQIGTEEMWRTFNCGIGMAIVVNASAAEAVQRFLTQAGETVFRIGQVVKNSAIAEQ